MRVIVPRRQAARNFLPSCVHGASMAIAQTQKAAPKGG